MRKGFLVAVCVCCSISPAFGGNGLSPIIVFRGGSERSSEIIWTKSSNIVAPDVSYDFLPVNNDWVAQDYLNSGNGYTLSPPPVPPIPSTSPTPDVLSFEAAIWGDSTISQATKLSLAGWFPLLKEYASNASVMQEAWAALVAQQGSSWLTQPVQQTVLGYAATYHIQLVPAQQ